MPNGTRLLGMVIIAAGLGLGACWAGCEDGNDDSPVGDTPTGDDSATGDDTGGDPDGDDTSPFDVEVDGYGIPWIRVPAGTYTMGCSPGDSDCEEWEHVKEVKIKKPFLMMQYELTNREFFEVFGEHPDPDTLNEKPDHPVHAYSGYNTCKRLGYKADDLPFGDSPGRHATAEEWEYAARAGTTTRYYCGDDPTCLDGIAWWSENTEPDYETRPVGQKAPNSWGFYDILGNAWEVIDDAWPCDEGIGWISTVVRGGGVQSDIFQMRVSFSTGTVECGGYVPMTRRCVKDIEE